MRTHRYASFAEAYAGGIHALLEDGELAEAVSDSASPGSRFGMELRPTVELRPYIFRVDDPLACLIACEPRQPSLAYSVGQWLWVVSGSDDLEQIAYYNSGGRTFSEDGASLPGAFGTRMRRSAGDQLQRAIALLRRDPASRRAVIVIAEAADTRSPMRDLPCASGVQFMVRDEKLEMITSMRSQSALMVLPYDAALFMMLHVWVAAVLELERGPHTWIANSFHLYEDELKLARSVVSRGAKAVDLPRVGGNPEGSLSLLLRYEEDLRSAAHDQPPPSPPRGLDDVGEFHGALAAVLRAHHASRSLNPAERAETASLLPRSWQPLWHERTRQNA